MKRKAGNPSRPSANRQVAHCHQPATQLGGSVLDVPPNIESDSEPRTQMTRLTMLQHAQNLLRFLNEDRARQRFCDVSVCVGGNLYSAHKIVLAHGSSYFHAELSKNPGMTRVTLDHVDDSVFRQLLSFMYTSECLVTETDLPPLIEAARFLDMMDMLKLLCEEGGNSARQDDRRGSPEVKTTSSGSPAVDADMQSTADDQSPSRNLQGGTESSLQDLATESQDHEHQEALAENGMSVTTRRSTRSRRMPTKYQKNVSEPSKPEVNLRRQNDGDSKEAAKAAEGKTELKESSQPPPEEDRGDELEEDGNLDEAVKRKNICKSGKHARQQGSGSVGRCKQTDGENPDPSTGSSIQSAAYPEGLAPIILVSSSKKTLQCPKCNKVFDRAGKYESHTRVHTGEKPFQCDICLQRYSTKSNLSVHRNKHAGDAPFQKKEHQCPFCSKLHASKKTLAKHVRRFHPDNIQEFLAKRKRKSEGWKCAICQKTFTRRPHLQEHMILHSQDRPFKCSFCDEFFKSRFARLKHQEKYHLGPFPCEICGRQFNDTGNRKRHIECTHGGKRKWTCFVCGKSVRERTTLKEHLRIHSGEKPHLCSICGQSFRHSSSYRLHLRVHHDDKRYECDKCGKTFIRHDHLTKHQKIHSGEKAHQCEECGKCFRRHDHLTAHYKTIHLGEKVWQKYKTALHQCEVCKKEFKGKSNLEMHFRTHSGEKPHKCPECNQTFRIKKTLMKHMVIHSDARPFSCAHCSATFKRKDKLKYHVDHVHSSARLTEQPAGSVPEVKVAPLEAPPKAYRAEPGSALVTATPPPNICVPVTLVPVPLAGRTQGEPSGQRASSLPGQTHGVASVQTPGQQQPQQPQQPQHQNSGYHGANELAFLEKYTLNPQPTNLVHTVRPDQMLDPRESYLGTLLGLDSSSSVQNISNSDHSH